MHVEMVVTGLTIDPVNNSPIVLLREKGGNRIVPIWIGAVEASAIAFELEGIKLPRPMTHDLLKSAVEALNGDVQKVAIVDLRENTYYAVVVLLQQGQTIEVDARPSDAIALALRAQAPILCAPSVIEKAQVSPKEDEPGKDPNAPPPGNPPPGPAGDPSVAAAVEEEVNEGPRPIVDLGSQIPEELLANLNPEDFGKYKM